MKDINGTLTEEAKRKAIFKKKMLKALLFFIIGAACCLIAGFMSPIKDLGALVYILRAGMLIFFITAACTFARALHDPLTPEEAKELADREKVEKGSER